MLNMVKIINELHTILLVHHIEVYINHKNIMYKNFTMEKKIIWSLLLE